MPAIERILRTDVYGGAVSATIGEAVVPGGWRNLLDGAGFDARPDGIVSGRVIRTPALGDVPLAIVNSRVIFIRGGQIVAEAVTDSQGEFQVLGLSLGACSFVIASDQGFLAVSTHIQPADEIVDSAGTEISFVGFDDGSKTSAEPAPPGDVQAVGSPAGGTGLGQGGPCGPFGPPVGAGGGGGFSGGGGGFSGGGGGFGGGGGGIIGPLLAGAAGAALGWALADDDDSVSP